MPLNRGTGSPSSVPISSYFCTLPKEDTPGDLIINSWAQIKSSSYIWYHLRVTPNEIKELDRNYVRDFIKDHGSKCWLVATEFSDKMVKHYHATFFEEKVMGDKARRNFREKLLGKFGVKGNSYVSLTGVRLPFQNVKYVLKEGEFEYMGFHEDFIAKAFRFSLSKKEKWSDAIADLRGRLELEEITVDEYKEHYLDIYIRYKSSVNRTVIANHFMKIDLEFGVLDKKIFLRSIRAMNEISMDRFLDERLEFFSNS